MLYRRKRVRQVPHAVKNRHKPVVVLTKKQVSSHVAQNIGNTARRSPKGS